MRLLQFAKHLLRLQSICYACKASVMFCKPSGVSAKRLLRVANNLSRLQSICCVLQSICYVCKTSVARRKASVANYHPICADSHKFEFAKFSEMTFDGDRGNLSFLQIIFNRQGNLSLFYG